MSAWHTLGFVHFLCVETQSMDVGVWENNKFKMGNISIEVYFAGSIRFYGTSVKIVNSV